MNMLQDAAPQKTCVTAVFVDGAPSFGLPDGATLADLAEHIASLGSLHDGEPTGIRVLFDQTGLRAARHNGRLAC